MHAASDKEGGLICDAVIGYFGGLEPFASTWLEHLDEACESRPGSREVLRHFSTIAKLVVRHRVPPPDVSDLSDEDLERELGTSRESLSAQRMI